MLPSKTEVPHFNFQEFFVDGVIEGHLIRLQKLLDLEPTPSDIVLNFEKCNWFDLFPLARLLSILCNRANPKPKIHIVGPSREILPYIKPYTLQLVRRLTAGSLSAIEEQEIEKRVRWHTKIIPNLRSLAGSFLIGWGIFDALNDHYGNCYWYESRHKRVSLMEMKQIYGFGYGSGELRRSEASDRVWPLTVVYRDDQESFIDKMNGDELIAGALKKHAHANVIQSGLAANVFLFEPFENVFQHAFAKPSEFDFSLVVIRILDWMYDKDGQMIWQAKWWLSRQPDWFKDFIKSQYLSPLMEIVVADPGVGIPNTLRESITSDTGYLRKQNLEIKGSFWSLPEAAWHAVKYAFEPHSTSKLGALPGRRGLAWIKEKIVELNGLIQVMSNGANFIMKASEETLKEVPYAETKLLLKGLPVSSGTRGTYVRILIPLKDTPRMIPVRVPRWGKKRPDASLFMTKPAEIRLFQLNSKLKSKIVLRSDWDSFLDDVSHTIGNDNRIAALDFTHFRPSRASLEDFFDSFLSHKELHGRILGVNCDRHIMTRMDTVESINNLKSLNVVLPLFDVGLRLYWIGAPGEVENDLLKLFNETSSKYSEELIDIMIKNRGYFIFDNEIPIDFSIRIEEVERVIREGIGQRLMESLEKRGVVRRGRYFLPTSMKTVSTFIEPHQIFADGHVAALLCNHLATLIRWNFGRQVFSRYRSIRVLTATRIGRDIAMRMPEGFDQKSFVYYDYHLIKPEKPRLMKHLKGHDIVIVVDIISTGTQVRELLQIAEDCGSNVLGVISMIDFHSKTMGLDGDLKISNGTVIKHLTFCKAAQDILEPAPGDILVDKYTLSVSPLPSVEREKLNSQLSILPKDVGLRFLEDSEAIHYGHYELFGHHYEFVVNLPRLLTLPSIHLDEILRACERIIFQDSSGGRPTAIVLYPDMSTAHILHAPLERRQRIKPLVERDNIRFVEVRRGFRGRGLRYWLTREEVMSLKAWAKTKYPGGFSIMILDDGASSGETLLALLELAREFGPESVFAFVIINRMAHIRTQHHADITRFIWATSIFRCMLHLNIPAFKADNCPLCKERAELIRQLNDAKEGWFKDELARRIQDLEIITALNAQDFPEGKIDKKLQRPQPFSWEEQDILPGPNATVISRAASVRVAINDGVPIGDIMKEISTQDEDNIWLLVIQEIARRTDLQLVQRAEIEIRDSLISVLSGRNNTRRIGALESLRYMRPEILLPALKDILQATLRDIHNQTLIAELLILLWRIFSYRHFSSQQGLEAECEVEKILDGAAAKAGETSPRLREIDRINHEWRNGPKPRLDLISVLRDLVRLLKLKYREDHQLLWELSRYIADRKLDYNTDVKAALDRANRAALYSKKFFQVLEEGGYDLDDNLLERAYNLHETTRSLRSDVEAHMRGARRLPFIDLRSMLDNLRTSLNELIGEIVRYYVNPIKYFETALDRFKTGIPEFDKCDIKIDRDYKLPKDSYIIVESSLFSSIISNLLSNLRHAIDSRTQTVRAGFSFVMGKEQGGPDVWISVQCRTRRMESGPSELLTTTKELVKEASIWGVEHVIPDQCLSDPHIPWQETWKFWGL